MAQQSSIEWTEATWNPIVGCSVISPGCKHCYAMKMAGRLALMGNADHYRGTTHMTKAGAVWTGTIAKAPEHIWREPLRRRRPTVYFVNSMSDLFHEAVPDAWIDRAFAIMALCPQHTFQVLTKRSKRMREYLTAPGVIRRIYEIVCDLTIELEPGAVLILPGTDEASAPPGPRVHLDRWPLPNVWLGVSTEDQQRADERIPDLLATPAAVRFISAEPLLGPIDLTCVRRQLAGESFMTFNALDAQDSLNKGPVETRLDWIIAGGESGAGARPMHPSWARSLRDQCAAAGVPFFFKQWGQWEPIAEWSPRRPDGSFRPERAILPSGLACPDDVNPDEVGGQRFALAGKKAAGRLLDGREWNAMPELRRPMPADLVEGAYVR